MRSLAIAFLFFGCGHSAPLPAQTGSGSGSEAQCEPGRCLADISKVIGGHKAESRACGKDKKLAGRVIINFTIDGEGKVGEASQGMQDDQIQDPALVECLSGVVKSITFAASPKNKTTRAYHRFEFGEN
jgi:hypothetical protein